MASKSGSGKKSGNTRIGNAGDKDRLIAELKDRVAVLENKFRLQQKDATSPGTTDCRQVEKELQESEVNYRDIVETADEGIWVLDRENRIVFINSRMAGMLGYPPEEMMGRFADEFVDKYYIKIAKFTFNNRKKGLKGDTDIKFRKKDGSEMWARISSSPRFKDGAFDGVLEMLTDITNDKHVAMKIAWLASFPNLNPEPIIEMSPFGQISYSNPAADKLFPDLRTANLNHPYLAGSGIIYAGLHKKGITVSRREVWVGADCYEQSFSFHAETDSLRIYGHNITSRKRAEEELRRSRDELDGRVGERTKELRKINEELEARILERNKAEEAVRFAYAYNRSLIEASLDPLVTIAPDGRITDVNKATEVVTGLSRDKLIGTDFSNYFTEPDRAREGYLMVFKEGSVKDYPLDIRHMDEHITPVLYNATVYHDDSGKVIGVFAAARDISGRKRAEEALLRARDELEMRVKERTSQLQRSNEELSVQIEERKKVEIELIDARTMAEFYLDLMGHDINNMNQVGMGFLELALNSSDIRGQDREFLFKSLGSLENSSRLIENVRKVQKARSGELKHGEVDACQTITRVLDRYSNLPGIKATINCDLPPSCPVIANDLLYEVFDNLVGNAIKHTGPDPVIDILFEKTPLDGRDYYMFAVEDNGPGIPDGLKDRIFNRLQRGATKAKGSGLGLYLVRSLVEDFHGTVHVEDRVRGDHTKGARFVVMLPSWSRSMP